MPKAVKSNEMIESKNKYNLRTNAILKGFKIKTEDPTLKIIILN